MTNPKLQFADDVARLLQMFPSFAAYAADVGKVGSLEQAATEAEARVAKAKADAATEEAAWKDTQKQWLASCDKMKADADAYVVTTKAGADKIIADARKDAATIMAQAGVDAAAILDDSHKVASQIEKAKADLKAVQDTTTSAKGALSDLDKQITAKQSELDAVMTKHAEFLKSIGA